MSIELYSKKVNGRPTYSIRLRMWINDEYRNVRIIKDDAGNYFTSKKAAQAYETDYRKKHATISSPDEITVFQLWGKYVDYAKGQIQPTTLYSKEKIMKKHIFPTFGSRPVKTITARDIMEWQNSLTAAGYAYKTKTGFRECFSSLLAFGMQYYDLPNPIRKVKTFKNLAPKKDINFWTPEEFEQFISVVDKPADKLFFVNQFITGMRAGEALALTRDDIRPDGIRINKSVSFKAPFTGVGYLVKATKNPFSVRVSFLPTPLRDMYAAYLATTSGLYVFGGERPTHLNSIRKRFQEYVKKADVKYIRIHDLRHSCASYLLNSGVSFQAVAEQLGHKDARETIETYAHLLPSAREKLHLEMNREADFLQKCTLNVPKI